jgi:hypothetical protein
MTPKLLQPIVEGLVLRCHHQASSPPHAYCGLPAVAFRKGRMLGPDVYLCAKHAGPTDTVLPASPLARSVTVRIDVTLAGVSQMHAPAQNEAVTRLEDAVRALGGVADVRQVTSQMVRIGPPRQPEAANPSADVG